MIRIGVGGWTYDPWRETFYPPGLPRGGELQYASRQLTSIEINGTFYRTQKPESFRRWAAETPDDFVFSVKAPRYATNRPQLAEAGPSIARFVDSGLLELGDKLGPILWQLPPNKRLDPQDLEGFLALLPRELEGRALRHALEVRHASFRAPEVVELLRRFAVALVFTDSDKYPSLADLTADFVYARLQRASEAEPMGYPAAELDRWAERLGTWVAGGQPEDLPTVAPEQLPPEDLPTVAPEQLPPDVPRSCFVYMIDGAKERAPAAAMALLERLRQRT